jgi:hypothetical protein
MNILIQSQIYEQNRFNISFYSDYKNTNNCHLNVSVTTQTNNLHDILDTINNENSYWTNINNSISIDSSNDGLYDFTINFSKEDTFANFEDKISTNTLALIPEIYNQSFYINIYSDYNNNELYHLNFSVNGITDSPENALSMFYSHLNGEFLNFQDLSGFSFNVSSDCNNPESYNYYSSISKDGSLDEIYNFLANISTADDKCDCGYNNQELTLI